MHVKHYLWIVTWVLLLPGCTTFDPPGVPWAVHSDPMDAGFSAEKLARVSSFTESFSTDAIVAVVDGKVLWEYGDTTQLSYVASVRKSILAMLYGNYVDDGTIDLDLTLADLGIDDVQGLLPVEKRATVRDLMTARSGVYHPASNAGDDLASAPARGSKEPGTYFLYSNWDFNAAGAVFERLTGRNIYDALASDLAQPLGFEHWERERHKKSGDTSRSINKAYHMWLSTRDMARIGALMLQEGNWHGVQLIPKHWVHTIVSVATPNEELNPAWVRKSELGYGYMWWVWDGPRVDCPYEGAYTARGAYGQFITVIPTLNMVVAHKTVPDDETKWLQYRAILSRLVGSREVSVCAPIL